MVILIVVVLSLVLGGLGYLALLQAGLVPGPSGQYREARGLRVPRLPELPQGCLLVLIVAGVAWFVLWSFVLVLALRFLRAPLG
ncbi:MAG: hypothetical protein ACRD1K_13560 [Acidimicrobiales bacterium]